MKPALPNEEWEHVERAQRGEYNSASKNFGISQITPNPHGLAALCLYGQPFGFTREDVDCLRTIHRYVSKGIDPADQYDDDGIISIADRIEALLPPETP